MRLENRTIQTKFKCPIDDNNLIYTKIRFNVNNGQWNFYLCPHCKAVYDRNDEEYLIEKVNKENIN